MKIFADAAKRLKDDRILVLRTKDGKKPKSSTGLIDPRLFTGENRLHAIRTPANLWYFKYDFGGLPEPLKEKFTSFQYALDHARRYLSGRNVEIVEIIA